MLKAVNCPVCSTELDIILNSEWGWHLPGGLNLIVENGIDWQLIGEIFINNCYLSAWEQIKIPVGRRVNIVDLGANVGLFSLWAADKLIQKNKSFSIFAVEPSKENCETYIKRFQNQVYGSKFGKFSVMNGAVGLEKTGEVELNLDQSHSMHSLKDLGLIKCANKTGTTKTGYIDADIIFENKTIDFLKCDIEGSEEDFVKTYAATLLVRTELFVAEIHHAYNNFDNLVESIKIANFENSKEIYSAGDVSLHMWWR